MAKLQLLLRSLFGLGDLARVREEALEAVEGSGVAEETARSFVCSINEGMTNAILHGGGSGELTISRDDGVRLVAAIHDDGVAQPFAVPPSPPPPDEVGGRGLWIADQLSDRLTVRTGPEGSDLVLELFLTPV